MTYTTSQPSIGVVPERDFYFFLGRGNARTKGNRIIAIVCGSLLVGTVLLPERTIAGASRGCPSATVRVDVCTDANGGDTSWEIVEEGFGIVAASPVFASNSCNSSTHCIDAAECHDFTIFDSGGNGIAMPGGYAVYLDGVFIAGEDPCCAAGAPFGASETVDIIGGPDGEFGTIFTDGFESGNTSAWSYASSSGGVPSGTNIAGDWEVSVVGIPDSLNGDFSVRLFADSNNHQNPEPYNVTAAIERTALPGTVLSALIEFDAIAGSGGVGGSYFQVAAFNAADPTKSISYGFSTTGDIGGDIKTTVSPSTGIGFAANIADDYFAKYGTDFTGDVIIRFLAYADYAEGGSGTRTTDVRIDDVLLVTGPDGLSNGCDNCPAVFNPGQEDSDANGIGDACLESPALVLIPDFCEYDDKEPPPPDIHILKNRYLTIDPRGANGTNFGQDFDIKATLTNTQVSGVTVVGSSWWAYPPDANCISLLGPTRPATLTNWDACPTLYLTGCSVIPTSTYDLVAVEVDGVGSSPPTIGETQLRPDSNKWWGDAVGYFCGTYWSGPQGVCNFDDVNASLKTFQNPNAMTATHVSWTDIHPNRPDLGGISVHPNKLVNTDDIFQFIKAFQGFEYPGFDLVNCTDP